MNDFTKEELKELMYGLYCRAKLDGSMTNKILYDKIKSMIDDYCDHEPCEYTADVAGVPVCKKCNRLL